MKVGVVLLNLGTPDDATVSSVRRYLREFLLDPRVIDLSPLLRYILVYGLILPFRPYKTVKAYAKIWQKEGSPLRLHMQSLAKRLSANLGREYQVVMGMRYGNPSIRAALKSLNNCEKIIILPLFPQYSSAATGSAIEEAMREISSNWNIPKVKIINEFYSHKHFVEPYADIIKPYLEGRDSFLLLSYHGLPERHLDKSICSAPCDRKTHCPAIGEANYFCYRAQCYQSSALLSGRLGLSSDRFMTAFQSRLGRTPWIKPYTDEVLHALRKKGVVNLVVACPSFVSDCLETLEEIGLQAKDQWLSLGGKEFSLVPCLNDNSGWVQGLSNFIHENTD